MSPGIPTRLLATQSDERLLALVREGHERAFEALVHRYRRPLLSYCRRLLPDARAEDVIQLALLKTWIAVREGAEVRDLKAWLYRVVHNTAANAVRDAAHDGESLTDPARRSAADESGIDLGLTTREALAEVAALPPLQREVIVRTAVAGHSHEQVASDLGISHGAVRGLLYRARTTLRTAITVLTPPPLLAWMAGRADQGGPAPERVAELAGGGATAGLGGLLLKGGVVAITAGTVLTGAAVVHLNGSAHRRDRHRLTATSASGGSGAAGRFLAPTGAGPERGVSGTAGRRSHRPAHPGGLGHRGASGATLSPSGGGRSVAVSAPGGRRCCGQAGHPPPAVPRGGPGEVAPRSRGNVPSATSPSNPGQESSQGGGSGESGGPGAAQSGPVGSAAGSGSGGGAGASSPPAQGSGEGGGAAPGGGQPGAGSGSSGSEGSSSGGQGSSSGSEPSSGSSETSSGSSGEQSGSLVGTVVHEVGNILEHLLH